MALWLSFQSDDVYAQTNTLGFTSATYDSALSQLSIVFDENIGEDIDLDIITLGGIPGATPNLSDGSASVDSDTLTITLSSGLVGYINGVNTNSQFGLLVLNLGEGAVQGADGTSSNLQLDNLPINILSGVAPPTIDYVSPIRLNNLIDIDGTAAINHNVELFRGSELVATLTADGSSGNWNALGVQLIEGDNVFTAIAIDANGNRSLPSSEIIITTG